ncbi:hypothetical protein SLE2022_252870 [Rubroshorea leprosula]
MIPIQKRHLRCGFEPNFVLRVPSQQTQALYGQVEVATMSELPNASPQRNQLLPRDVGSALHQRLAHVVDLVLLEPEAIAPRIRVGSFVRWVLDDVLQVVAGEFE